jgi:elongator complex protein 2
MNKPVLVSKAKRDIDEDGGQGMDFDPTTFLSNNKVKEAGEGEEVKKPPVEDTLLSRTLWPEKNKLYGHQHEVFCVATTHKGDLAASACKAKDK